MNSYFFDRFLRFNCAPDILAKWGKTPAKELTECMAVYQYLLKNYLELFSENCLCLDIGSGKTPRFAILIVHLTKWNVIAIDPNLNVKDYKTERLFLQKKNIEDCNKDIKNADQSNYKHIFGVYIHSHGSAKPLLENIKLTPLTIIAIPCCYPIGVEDLEGKYYSDGRILSDKRRVYVFNKNHDLRPVKDGRY